MKYDALGKQFSEYNTNLYYFPYGRYWTLHVSNTIGKSMVDMRHYINFNDYNSKKDEAWANRGNVTDELHSEFINQFTANGGQEDTGNRMACILTIVMATLAPYDYGVCETPSRYTISVIPESRSQLMICNAEPKNDIHHWLMQVEEGISPTNILHLGTLYLGTYSDMLNILHHSAEFRDVKSKFTIPSKLLSIECDVPRIIKKYINSVLEDKVFRD